MDDKQIDVNVVDQWSIEDIASLYKAGNWWEKEADSSFIPSLIKNSFAFVVAVNKETDTAVGMGRVLSDGVSDAYIQDVVVLKDWRGNGVGKMIVKKLIDHCLSKNVKWIALISEPNQEGFYLPLGFKEMKHYVPMKFENVI
ncbi:GNAT family N-acetyltransferase [Thermoplasmatales archaeon ex4572_165]|nr:MAG: GNAT family N-acetyltransferase [Thermoplasmatales archaeon ex4572_165]